MVKFFPFWQIWLIIFQTISTNFSFCRTAFLSFLSFLMCFWSWYVKCITMWTALKWKCPLSFTYHFKMGGSLVQFLYFPHSKLWSWSTCASCPPRLRLSKPFQNLLFWANLLWVSLKRTVEGGSLETPVSTSLTVAFVFRCRRWQMVT